MYVVRSRICGAVVKIVFASFLAVSSAQAAVLLIDPSTSTAAPGTTTFPTANVPYSVNNATAQWNRSNATGAFAATLRYSDNSVATGVTVVADELQNAGAGGVVYNFTTSSTGSAGTTTLTGGVFEFNPTNNAAWGAQVASVGYGGVGMKVGGLALGTYDIYMVAAYVGSTAATRPGGVSAASYNLWAFSGANLTTLATDSYGSPQDTLENTTPASWIAGNNYTKLTVTLTAANPYLYLVSEGAANDSRRGWLNSVQIVSVPEPVAPILLSLGAVTLFFRRRRF